MDVILIPGLWLDRSSWDEVVPGPGRRRPAAGLVVLRRRGLVDLDDGLRAAFRERAIPSPERVARDPQRLTDERRYAVPSTVIACEFPSATLREWMAAGEPSLRELARLRDVGYVDLPTGHWPQFTRPKELAQAILRSIGPRGAAGTAAR
ncbi:hypothetical protein [Streptomyces sp. 6N223]|uniref:hypothetical protein n=1 Tax=Streptomyces sp. 6N223 TaxID=3457412 RepID=UPI003FD40665